MVTKMMQLKLGENFHSAAGDAQVRQKSTESLLCTLLIWTAVLGLGVTSLAPEATVTLLNCKKAHIRQADQLKPPSASLPLPSTRLSCM